MYSRIDRELKNSRQDGTVILCGTVEGRRRKNSRQRRREKFCDLSLGHWAVPYSIRGSSWKLNHCTSGDQTKKELRTAADREDPVEASKSGSYHVVGVKSEMF